MASPFRSYESYFQDLQGGQAPTYGPGLVQEPQRPQTPPSPRTPTFGPMGQQERPAAFQGFGAQQTQPQPQPTRQLAAAVGGGRRQAPSQAIPQGFGSQPRSLYTSAFQPSATPTPAPAPPTGGPLVQEAPPTGGPLTYQPPAPAPVAAPAAAPVAPPPPELGIYGMPEPRQLVGYEAPVATQDFYSQLTSPLLEDLQQGYGALGGAQEEFYGQLPDIQTWEALGGSGLIQTALGAQGPERLAAEERLREILGTEYTGAAGLDLGAIEDLYGIQAELDPYAGGTLGTQAGVGTLLEQYQPGLTPGMRREEARRLLGQEEFRGYGRQLGRDIGRLGGTTTRETEAAMEAATGQREAAEALRGEGRGALETERGAISQDVASRLEEAQAARTAQESAYEEFAKTGDLSHLAPYGITPEMFQSDLSRLDVEAQAAKAQVMDDPRFSQIADVPLMQLGISSHGREKLDFPQEWYEENKDKYTKAQMADMKKLARERQKALDEAGFARPTYKGEGGKYAGVENIYFGQGDVFEPGKVDPYLSVTPGNLATRHSMATEAQREDFNIINDILGEADRLQETDPYQAAQIVADTVAYIDDLETQYEETFGELKGMGAKFDSLRKKARKAYRKSTSTVGKITGELGDIFGSDLGEVFSPIAHKTPIPGIKSTG